MPSLGSVTEGMVGTTLDLQNVQLNQYKLAEAPINLAEDQIKLQQDKLQLQQQTKLLSLMQNIRPSGEVNTPDAVADVMGQLSLIQLEAGMPDAAAKTANIAATIQDKASVVDYRSFQMQNTRLTRFANILSTVPDSPQGYALAIQTMMSEDPGVAKDKGFQRIAQQPWQPGLITRMQTSVLNAKDRLDAKYKEQQEKHLASQEKVDAHKVNLIDAQTRLADQRATDLKKEGITTVKAGQLQAIVDQASVDYPGADPADLRVRSRALAEEMVKMIKEQHLTQSEAATRVYQQAKRGGVFKGLRTAPVIPGSKSSKPLPLPESQDKMQENQWYMVEGVPKVLIGSKLYTEDELTEMDEDEKNVDPDADTD